MENKTNFFKTKDDAVRYIYTKLDNPTPIKLQKALYFVWAFYAATYGNVDTNESEIKDSDASYPEYLFRPNFEAWKYGPVDSEVWADNNEGNIKTINLKHVDKLISISNESVIKDVLSFVDDMINQVKDVNDFGLVNRSHEDSAWKDVWKDKPHIHMDPEEIKKIMLNMLMNKECYEIQTFS